MKKIKDIIKYQRFQRKRSRKEQRKRNCHKLWRKQRNRHEQGISREAVYRSNRDRSIRWQYKNIVYAPSIFNFIGNTEEVVKFIQQIEEVYQRKRKVFVELKNVKEIDYGAIVTLLSIMVKFRSSNIKFNGSFPRDHKIAELLINSGFFENLSNVFKEEDRYEISKRKSDGIHTHAMKNVDSQLGARIIQAASATVWGEERRCQGIQRTLLELMQNTNNHAEIGKEGEKHWWLSVNHVKRERKVCFSFVDFGVGIFKSLQNKPENSKWYNWATKIADRIRYGDNKDILKLMLNGEFHQTVTGKHYRGKGLPGIAEVQKRNQITNLRIVTNDVSCWFDNSEYKKMDSSFNGTFVYWELNETNGNCKEN